MAGALVLGIGILLFLPSLVAFGPGVFVGANYDSSGLEFPPAAWGALGLAVASATHLAGCVLGLVDLLRGSEDLLGGCLIPALNALGALAYGWLLLVLLTVAA